MAQSSVPPRPADSKRKKWVFNPPPGWTVPPAGWQPPPGWEPHPACPPAPADWKFWKPEKDPGRHPLSTSVKAIVAALTLVATLAGAYFTWLAVRDSKTPPVATASWVRHANADCDQDVGALNESIFAGLAPATAGQVSSSSAQTDRVSAIIAAEGSLSKLVGDLAGLPTPQDGHASQVQAVISSGRTLIGNLGTFSTAAAEAVANTPGTTLAQDLANEQAAYKQFETNLVVWRKAIGAIGLTQCPFYSSNPNAPVTSPQPPVSSPPPQIPPASLTYGEQELVNSLNPTLLTNCTPPQALVGGSGITAAVNCSSVAFGPTLRPLVVQFADLTSAVSWFANNTVGYVNQDGCAAGSKLGLWYHNNTVSGLLGCSYLTNGDFRIIWIIDNSLIGVIADGSDGPAMNTWWENSAYLVSDGF